jgi:hypothetical protein
MEEIKLYLFVLSMVFTIRYVAEFVFKLAQTGDSEPIVLTKLERSFLYLALSYIITYIII